MSKEMKMVDYFNLPVTAVELVSGDKCILDGFHECISDGYYDDFEKAAAHAINNHDRLVEENKKLREFCESLQLDVSNEIKLDRLLSEMDGEHE